MTDATRSDVVGALVDALTAGHPTEERASAWSARLSACTTLVSYADGEVLVRRHETASHLDLLVEGEVAYDHLVSGREQDHVTHESHPWLPVGWSGLTLRRHRATAVGVGPGTVLRLPLHAWDDLARTSPELWARLAEFTFRSAAPVLWQARGTTPPTTTTAPGVVELAPAAAPEADALRDLYRRSACFAPLPSGSRTWLAEHSEVLHVPAGTQFIHEGAHAGGLWLLLSGRAAMRFRVRTRPDRTQTATRHAVRAGTLLAWSTTTGATPSPYDVAATRDSTVVHVPRAALAALRDEHPAWAGAVFEQQLWQLRRYLLSTRTHEGGVAEDGGITAVQQLVADSTPALPVNSLLYGVPHLLDNKLTRDDGFRRLYQLQFDGTPAEQSVASLALDLVRDLERGHRFLAGLQATYEAVVRSDEEDPAARRRLASRWFRDALTHVPYVIKGVEHLPADGNCILIYNHMAYADDSILPNGFLFNPDSHFVSSILMEPTYGDGIRIARTNAATEFWRADYYDRLGHIGVVTPESGWLDETPEEKEQRKQDFLAACEAVLASGQPFAIAPEGTITEEESTTARSPGPMKAGAFLMSARFPSRPTIVPVALANFDEPAHRAVFSCVVKPPFTMDERGVDVEDPEAMQAFLRAYRREFRGHVEEAAELARAIQEPEADLTGLVTNLGEVDVVNEEFEHDVRALEHAAVHPPPSAERTVFYGSSTFRMWHDLADAVGVRDAVNLGFGGSTFEACRRYFERLVVPQAPARLVLYCGDNDLARGATADKVTRQFDQLAELVQTLLPRADCWFVSIKPSPGRRGILDEVERANHQIAARIRDLPRWSYVDWHRYLVDQHGMPTPALFTADEIHVNEGGYGVLGTLLRNELAHR